jgi:hypothetical protein
VPGQLQIFPRKTVRITMRSMINSLKALAAYFNIKIVRYDGFRDILNRLHDLNAEVVSVKNELGSVKSQANLDHTTQVNLRRKLAAIAARHRREKAKLAEIAARHRKEKAKFLEFIAKTRRPLSSSSWSTDNKQVLITVITTVSQFPHLKALAASATVQARYHLIVVANIEITSKTIEFCRLNRITLLNYRFELLSEDPNTICDIQASSILDDDSEISFEKNAPLEEYSSEHQIVLKHVTDLLTEVQRQSTLARRCQKLLLRSAASLVLMFEDNAGYDTAIWTAVAGAHSVPTVILPFTVADRLEAKEALYQDPRYWADEGIYNRLAKGIAPDWVDLYHDRPLLRRTGISVLAAEATGHAPSEPWVLNGNEGSVIAVESRAMYQHYLGQGISQTRLEITGSLTDDLLCSARENSDRIRHQLSLKPNFPTLLCAFPPNQLSANRPDCEFDDFRKLSDFWMGELLKLKRWQVVVKPHPALKQDEVEYLKKFDLLVSDFDTTSLIPICDLFNTSVSSTIRWALACGKPVLNFDVFKYRYRDFVSEPAVIHAYSCEEFSAELNRLTTSKDALKRCKIDAEAAAPNWGLLDGGSTERIMRLFARLTNQSFADR